MCSVCASSHDTLSQVKTLMLAGEAKLGDGPVVAMEQRMQRLTEWIASNKSDLEMVRVLACMLPCQCNA